jgi:hypothetical protein
MRTFRVVIPVYLRAEEIHEVEAETAEDAKELALERDADKLVDDPDYYEINKGGARVTPMEDK